MHPEGFAAASTCESSHPKPDPKALDAIFRAIPVPREHAVYVGDWYPDIDTAPCVGVRCIAVFSGGLPRRAFLQEGVSEEHIITGLRDLPSLIETT
jgi:phosphoglycolate phosphatase-like HAD superfamily hydrolase